MEIRPGFEYKYDREEISMMSIPPRGGRTAPRSFRASAALAVLLLLVSQGTVLVRAQAKLRPKDLAPQYQEWLKQVDYIVKDKERDVFLHLDLRPGPGPFHRDVLAAARPDAGDARERVPGPST